MDLKVLADREAKVIYMATAHWARDEGRNHKEGGNKIQAGTYPVTRRHSWTQIQVFSSSQQPFQNS